MTDTAVLQTRLTEVEAALHSLQTGKAIATVKYDGREVSYSQSNINDLRIYKRELEEQLGLKTKRRSMRVTF